MRQINHVQRFMAYATPMGIAALQAWASLYTAVALCAGICSALALGTTAYQLWIGSWRPDCTGTSGIILAVPRIWLHWQVQYLTGAPAVLAIGVYYAHHLGFSTLAGI